jgi:hypothetical protein
MRGRRDCVLDVGLHAFRVRARANEVNAGLEGHVLVGTGCHFVGLLEARVR